VTQATDLVDLITVPATAKTAQAALSISSSTAQANGASVTLATAGGSGTGAVTYALTSGASAGCTLTNGVLSVTGSASALCGVTATKAGDAMYGAATASASIAFGTVDNPTAANPDTVSVAITGTNIVNSTPIENTNSWWNGHFGGGYAAATDWNYTYIHSGAAITLTYTVLGSNGKPLKFAPVALDPYFVNNAVTATATGATALLSLNSNNQYVSSTDGSGVVSFTFTLSGTGNYFPADQTAGEANNIEGNKLDAFSRTVLYVGTDVFTGAAATVNEAGPMTDFIIVPTGVNQATLSISNSTLKVATGTSITLTTAGGSGSGSVSLDVTGTGCQVSGNTLSVSGGAAAVCDVTATKAADTTYGATTSVPAQFVFGSPADSPSAAFPDNVTVSISGTNIVNSTPIENTNLFWVGHFGGTYAPATDWNYTYIHSGAAITLTYHVTGTYGQALANTAVTLYPHFYGTGGTSTTWTATGDTASYSVDQYGGLQATTDGNGDVTFTLTESDSGATYTNADLTAGEANNIEYNNLDPYTRMVLQIDGDTFTGPAATLNEAGPMTDFIVVPTA
jgi:protocatechuate 3,4-dioxygenase beta subunit